MGVGCFHMKYYLFDKLIAVGVVDVLPQVLSSVYFFYDPDYKKYSLGVFGSLQEIEYIKKNNAKYPHFRYYYMGYYIQSSQKMVYKGTTLLSIPLGYYYPSELLCPYTFQWVAIDEHTKALIDQDKESARLDFQSPVEEDMDLSAVELEKYVVDKTKLFINGK